MIEEAIQTFLTAIGDRFLGFIGWFTDPFWGWAWSLLCLYAICVVIVYFFGAWFPKLRGIAGVVLAIATFGLYAFSKGQKAARDHDRRGRLQ